jgi:colicin import membrane protein
MARPAGSPPAAPPPRASHGTTRERLRPPSADRIGRGATISAAVHLGLIGALALGVSWHAEAPTPVSAAQGR